MAGNGHEALLARPDWRGQEARCCLPSGVFRAASRTAAPIIPSWGCGTRVGPWRFRKGDWPRAGDPEALAGAPDVHLIRRSLGSAKAFCTRLEDVPPRLCLLRLRSRGHPEISVPRPRLFAQGESRPPRPPRIRGCCRSAVRGASEFLPPPRCWPTGLGIDCPEPGGSCGRRLSGAPPPRGRRYRAPPGRPGSFCRVAGSDCWAAAMALLMEYEFRTLPADKQIDTEPFLEAVTHLPPFFDCLGTPLVYAPVKADLSGNIKKIRAVYETNPAKFKTLQNILEAEKEMHGPAWPKVGATLALMWLKRGLKFIQVLLQSLCDGEQDKDNPNLIRVNATKAYELALRKYHGWMLQKLFLGSVYALPYKSDLLKALEKGQDVKQEETFEKIHQFLSKATPILDTIYEMYTKMNAELSYKA